MLTSNNLLKINDNGEIVRVNTDDIPEGEYNKYCLSYADGKQIGDVFCRQDIKDTEYQCLLDGRKIHLYSNKLFYEWANECKELAQTDDRYEFFNKTEEEYNQFLQSHVFEETQQNYCPYFVVGESSQIIYEVTNEFNELGYTNISGEKDIEVSEGLIYGDVLLSVAISSNEDWFYNGNSLEAVDKWVRIPTYASFLSGNTKNYWYILTNSRVDDDTTSIRSVQVGNTTSLSSEESAYVRNSGTLQNLVLDFGIPKGERGVDGQRGPQGPAGGIVSLQYVASSFPANGNQQDKFYNTSDNKIYIYESNNWVFQNNADEGVIYIKDTQVYHYNGNKLVEFNNVVKTDNTTITNEANILSVIGRNTMNGKILYDWIGTEAEWRQQRLTGQIKDDWICIVTDDDVIEV